MTTPLGIGRAGRPTMRWNGVVPAALLAERTGCSIATSKSFSTRWIIGLVVRAVKANTDQPLGFAVCEAGGLHAPLRLSDGTLQDRDRGTPQGSAVSPVLANLVLHYAFDMFLDAGVPEL